MDYNAFEGGDRMETFCFIYFWAIYCLKCKHDAYEQISQIFGKLVTHTYRCGQQICNNGIYINFKTVSSMPKRDKYVRVLCVGCDRKQCY